VLALAACAPVAAPRDVGRGAAESTAQAPERTLVIALRGEPPSLATKEVQTFSGSLRNPTPLFNATLDGVDESEQRYPYLAEALPQLNTATWQVFPDGRMTTTYRLKPNLTWHDGTALTGEDFAFAWRVYSTRDFGQAASPPLGQMEDVQAPDLRTILIRWRQPFPEADQLDDDRFQALPRHLLEQQFQEMDHAAFAAHPFWSTEYVGLGPYRLTRWEPGAFIEARAFEGHALGTPKIEQIKLIFIPDPNTALANLLAGEVHYVGEFIFSDDHAKTLEAEWASTQAGSVLYSPTALRTIVVQVRPGVADPAALADVRVRRALAHAIDKETAIEVLYRGRGIITPTITSPQAPYHPQIERVIAKYPLHPRRSQQLMEELGFNPAANGLLVGRDGGSFRVSFTSSSGAKNETEAAVILDSLRKAGFDAVHQVLPAAQLRDPEARATLPGLATRGGGGGISGLRYYTSEQIGRAENRWRGENRGGWASAPYDHAFDVLNSTLDPAERIRRLGEAERILTSELPAIPAWYEPGVTAHLRALKGPVARQTPDVGPAFMKPHLWEWIS